MMLYEQGKFQMDDPISKVWSDLLARAAKEGSLARLVTSFCRRIGTCKSPSRARFRTL